MMWQYWRGKDVISDFKVYNGVTVLILKSPLSFILVKIIIVYFDGLNDFVIVFSFVNMLKIDFILIVCRNRVILHCQSINVFK